MQIFHYALPFVKTVSNSNPTSLRIWEYTSHQTHRFQQKLSTLHQVNPTWICQKRFWTSIFPMDTAILSQVLIPNNVSVSLFPDTTAIKLPEDSHSSAEMPHKENHHGSMNLFDHRSCERWPTSAKGDPWLLTPLCQGINRTRKTHMNILKCPILRNRAEHAKHNCASSPWDSWEVNSINHPNVLLCAT